MEFWDLRHSLSNWSSAATDLFDLVTSSDPEDDHLTSSSDLGCNSIDILGLAQFRAQNLAQVLSDRNAGILDLTLLGPALIQLAQLCGPVLSPVEV